MSCFASQTWLGATVVALFLLSSVSAVPLQRVLQQRRAEQLGYGEDVVLYPTQPVVDNRFRQKVAYMCQTLGLTTTPQLPCHNWMLVLFDYFTDGTFSGKYVKKPKKKVEYTTARSTEDQGVGLIQFTRAMAQAIGMNQKDIAIFSELDQLDFVLEYFQHIIKTKNLRVRNLDDLFLTLFWPEAIGKDDNYILFSEGSPAYERFEFMDNNQDKQVSKAEALFAIRTLYQKQGGNPRVEADVIEADPNGNTISAPVPNDLLGTVDLDRPCHDIKGVCVEIALCTAPATVVQHKCTLNSGIAMYGGGANRICCVPPAGSPVLGGAVGGLPQMPYGSPAGVPVPGMLGGKLGWDRKPITGNPVATPQSMTPIRAPVLVVGDEHMIGQLRGTSFGEVFYQGLSSEFGAQGVWQFGRKDVESTWFYNKHPAPNGFRDRIPPGGAELIKMATNSFSMDGYYDPSTTPLFSVLLNNIQPKTVVIAIGAHEVGKSIGKAEQMAQEVRGKNAACFWVGPPRVRQRSSGNQALTYTDEQLANYYAALIRSQVGQLCTVIRSDAVGMPELDYDNIEKIAKKKGDGVLFHTVPQYGEAAVKQWAERVLQIILRPGMNNNNNALAPTGYTGVPALTPGYGAPMFPLGAPVGYPPAGYPTGAVGGYGAPAGFPTSPTPAYGVPPLPSKASNCKLDDIKAMKTNRLGIDIISINEALSTHCDKRADNVWRVGFGHFCAMPAEQVYRPENDADPVCKLCRDRTKSGLVTIEKTDAQVLLAKDILEAEKCVQKHVSVQLNFNQFSALVSYAFGKPCSLFQNDPVFGALNSGRFSEMGDVLRAANMAPGGVDQTTRRHQEALLFANTDCVAPTL